MNSSSDDLPKSPRTRFVIGFSIAALLTFFGFFLYSGGSKDEFLESSTAAVICGFVVGLLSAFGKKWLSFFLEFFTWFSI